MSASTEYMKPVFDLYREVATGELQARVAAIGPVNYHPDYLSLNERRYDLDTVGSLQQTLSPLMKQFAENNGQALALEEILPSLKPGQVDMSHQLENLNALVKAKLLNGEKDETGTWMLSPRDEAYELDHDQPFYRPSTAYLASATFVSALMTGGIVTGNAAMGAPEWFSFYESAQAGGFGGFMLSGLVSAVNARRFYKKHGF